MFYREDKKGQILEEGINEAGAMSSWIAAGTSYSTHNQPMLPFYIFYSMFGFQRIGDLAWAAGDSRAHGFLIGGTAGRTTLNGEGLQHEDGHSHLLASTIPNCRTYDPTYAYELAVIIREGSRQMIEEQQDIFYYITVMNENYVQPAMPKGAEEGIIKGMYLLEEDKKEAAHHVQLLGSGTILREVEEAAKLLRNDFGIGADVWSVPSFNEPASRRPCRRALEPPASGPEAEAELRRGVPGRPSRPGDRLHRLHEALRRADPPVGSLQGVQGARHRRLRPQRQPQEAAQLLRSGSSLGGAGRARSAGRSRRYRAESGGRGHRQVRYRSGEAQPAGLLIRSILPSAARGFEHAGAANGRRRLTTNQGPKVFVLRAAQRWWHVKGEECERTHSRTRHRQR